jgi:ABC-type polysaccharide/polyol phosphate export permease
LLRERLADPDTGWALLGVLSRREIQTKYRGTALGNLWSLLNPLAAMLIYTVVFGFLLRVSPDPGEPSGLDVFAVWLLAGLLPWNFFSNSMMAGMGSLLGNENLLKKVYFPRWVLVGSQSVSWFVTFTVELLVLVVVLLVVGGRPLIFLPAVAVLAVMLALMAYGAGLGLSIGLVYFRDLQYLMSIVLQIWFFLTTIVYPPSVVAKAIASVDAGKHDILGFTPPIRLLYELNPMQHFIDAFRALLYDNRMPAATEWLWCGGFTVVYLVLGWAVFRRFAPGIVEEL